MNSHHEWVYKHMHGDKDTFLLAFSMAGRLDMFTQVHHQQSHCKRGRVMERVCMTTETCTQQRYSNVSNVSTPLIEQHLNPLNIMTLNPQPLTMNPTPLSLNPQPKTSYLWFKVPHLNPQPHPLTLNPEPST